MFNNSYYCLTTFIFILNLSQYVCDRYGCETTQIRICNRKREMAEDMAKKTDDSGVSRSITCCKEWDWNECMTRAIETIDNNFCKKEFQNQLKARQTNVSDSAQCKDFPRESIKCFWPFWVYLVLMICAYVVTICFVCITIYVASKTSHKHKALPEAEQMTGYKSKTSSNKTFAKNDTTKSVANKNVFTKK